MDINCDAIKDILDKESRAIIEARDHLDAEAITALIKLIIACKGNLLFAGCGTSGAAAKKVAHMFSCVGYPSFFLDPTNAVHGGLGVVGKHDMVFLFSKGGGTTEINRLIQPIKTKDAFIVGVTENPDSELAQSVDLHLRIAVETEADSLNVLATSSIIGLIAVFDAVAITVGEQTGFSKAKFGVIHPGGAVGASISKEQTIMK